MMMFDHADALSGLNGNAPLSEKLRGIHIVLAGRLPYIARVAVALYDEQTDVLKTFTHSSEDDNPLSLYETKLAHAPSLKAILDEGRPRVVQDLEIFQDGQHEHTRRIGAQGYRASYTLPIFHNGEFVGFLFFNSYEPNCFDNESLSLLDIFGHLIALTVINEFVSIRTLIASVQAARHVTQYRDVETGAHVSRTAHYARLIAQELAPKYQLTDEYIEHVFLFSPLHDIGKISVPDAILCKPGRLTAEEFEVMKTHTSKGREIIDVMLKDFALSSFSEVEILRNIALYHHEAVDGSGYPFGLKGAAIPLEARISAVADVFDALTSRRPYKAAWSNQEAWDTLRELAGSKLDAECAAVLIDRRDKVAEIQQRFRDGVDA
jgi:HD-GYP domain-containing protein (c-di-GMP phosphodiesterase class II)